MVATADEVKAALWRRTPQSLAGNKHHSLVTTSLAGNNITRW